MQIVRFATEAGRPGLGLLDDGRLVGRIDAGEGGLAGLLRLRPAELRARIENARPWSNNAERPSILAPIDGQTEVWAAGVTYKRSEEARVEESGTPDVYTKVYSAERPELFFKATPRRVAGPAEPIAVRADSTWDVPRSEEHTSELQSRQYLVCRLL